MSVLNEEHHPHFRLRQHEGRINDYRWLAQLVIWFARGRSECNGDPVDAVISPCSKVNRGSRAPRGHIWFAPNCSGLPIFSISSQIAAKQRKSAGTWPYFRWTQIARQMVGFGWTSYVATWGCWMEPVGRLTDSLTDRPDWFVFYYTPWASNSLSTYCYKLWFQQVGLKSSRGQLRTWL